MAKRDSSRRAAAADANVSRSSRVVQRRIIACSEKPGHRGKNIIKKRGLSHTGSSPVTLGWYTS